ncbi:MAG: flagellar export chaperone FliS [Mariprofundaceae bacterium]|nr:flagellar export chaperone FliS [Mariprofundaceae bacterium]
MSGYKAYRGNSVNTASPLGLVILSYDALYKALWRAEHAIDGGDLAAEADHTGRAVEALIELSSSLNIELGGDVAYDLASLYAYMMRRLNEGMCSCSTDAVEEVMKLVLTLREGWEGLSPVRQASIQAHTNVVPPRVPAPQKLTMPQMAYAR